MNKWLSIFAWLYCAAILLTGCDHSKPDNDSKTLPPPRNSTPQSIQFTDVTAESGIRFVHANGGTGQKYMPETMGAGCAFLDFDQDGWLDIILLNDQPLPGSGEDPQPSQGAGSNPTLVLYHNDGKGKFVDVTSGSGLESSFYAMGCCVGDYDNDGKDDLFVTACNEANRLYHNEGQGKFKDVTNQMGVGDKRWGTSCAWLDYNKDGWLDLFVCNYVHLELGVNDRCARPDGRPAYCHPDRLPTDTSILYRNDRGRGFRDVSQASGIVAHQGKGLGVAVRDYDGDGWPDIFVANDKVRNFLYRNRRNGTFEEVGLTAGVAYAENGEEKAGMGIDIADISNDGRCAVLISNFNSEGLSLFHQDSPPYFLDVTFKAGMGESSLPYLGFGLFFFDYNNDGWQDAFVANGHIQPEISEYQKTVTYKERSLLFRNNGSGSFDEVGMSLGKPFTKDRVGRGASFGDYDNDGDLDILLNNNNDPAELLRNDGDNRQNWLQVDLKGTRSNRDGIGAYVVAQVNGMKQTQWVHSGSSYLSQSMLRLHFGLGKAAKADRLEVHWPSGIVDIAKDVKANQRFVINEGSLQEKKQEGKVK